MTSGFNASRRRLLAWLLPACVWAGGPANYIRITDLSGANQTDRPFSISRIFAQGEIPQFVQAKVGNTLLQTQCDVKTRWADGSVQHAIVSFVADVSADHSLTIEFVNQPDGNNAGSLTKSEILDSNALWAADLGAQIVATQGTTQVADLRAMLTEWDGQDTGENGLGTRYWLKGPIVSQLIVGDRDPTSLRYDFGWDCSSKDLPCTGGWSTSRDAGRRSLHPVFVITIYRGSRAVKVEAILENTWTTKLQDQSYSLEIRLGHPLSASPAYSRENLSHLARTRWRKTFWSGTAPGAVRIDHNFAYLIHTRVLPSYDLSKQVGLPDVQKEVSSFLTSDGGDINGHGQWLTAFPTAGGRGDIGLFPRWYVRYLYTFDPQLYEVLLGNAAVSGHVPIHYRESLSGRYFDDLRTVEAFGRTLSIDARPTVRTTSQSQDTRPEDAITPVGPVTTGPWTVDLAHQPSFAFIPYLITGDWYFLEELYFWAAYNLARGNPGTTQSYHRHADWGIINNDQEIRGVAWGLRNLAHAALAAPDGSPEKAYFTQKLHNNIAVREGMYNITEGAFYEECRTSPYRAAAETSKWCWGRNTAAGGRDNPLHFLEEGNPGLTSGLDTQKVYSGSSPWMLNYNHIVLGHLNELGFPVAKLHQTIAKNLLNQILNAEYNPFLVASYRIPVVRQTGKTLIDNWQEVKAGFLDPAPTVFREADARDVEHGYIHIARAAASFLPGIQDGPLTGEDAWTWLRSNVPYENLLNSNPKWALVPRSNP